MSVPGRRLDSYGDEMTFEEIGREMGVTMQRARAIYKSAMYKIRKSNNREAVNRWAELVRERRKLRDGGSTI